MAKTEYDKLMAHVETARAEKQKEADKKRSIHNKQLAYVKEHQEEIVELIKAQSPQIESVQIDWRYIHRAENGSSDGDFWAR